MKPPELVIEVITGGAWLLFAPPDKVIPSPLFEKMELDNTALRVEMLPTMATPSPLFLEMRLPAAVVVPPIVLTVAGPSWLKINTPLAPLDRAAVPETSVPM